MSKNQTNWVRISSAMIMASISMNSEVKNAKEADSNKINIQTILTENFEFEKDSSPCKIIGDIG